MTYENDIFISYRRSPTVGAWVRNHLVPRLEARINEVSPAPVRVFCDFMMEEGVRWPEELKRRVRNSRLLVTIWSADYFRSSWCMAEWRSFRDRESLLNLFTEANPQGLVYPVRYADGEYFHGDAKLTQCRKDFSNLSYPDDSFRTSVKYLEFDDLVRQMALELVARLPGIPPWRNDFPIVEPAPLPQVDLPRPVL